VWLSGRQLWKVRLRNYFIDQHQSIQILKTKNIQLQNLVPYYLITQPTNSLQQSSSWRPPRIPYNQNVQHSVHKSLPVFPVFNHIIPNQNTSSSFFKTHFTNLLRSRHGFSLPILSSFIWLSWYHSVRITNCEVRNYSNLSKLLLLPLRGEKNFVPPPCSRIPSFSVLPWLLLALTS
jgi:hypothetical protein